VRLTGTVIFGVPLEYSANTICPLYVPAASEAEGFTLTIQTVGVVYTPPEGESWSQEPPVVVEAVASTLKFDPVLAMATVWGSGFAPAKVLVKDSAGTLAKVWPLATEVVVAKIKMAGRATQALRKNRVDGMSPPKVQNVHYLPRTRGGDSISKGTSTPFAARL
jgi:hypothetical protein